MGLANMKFSYTITKACSQFLQFVAVLNFHIKEKTEKMFDLGKIPKNIRNSGVVGVASAVHTAH